MNRSLVTDEVAQFVRVVDLGSFAAAAAATGLTPSGISKTITRLEARLGVRLLNRTTRRLAITAEGEILLARGRELLATIEAMESEVTAARGKPKGRVRVSAGTVYARRCLLPLLPEFHAQYPDIEVELSIDDRRIDILAGQFDVAIRTGALDDSSLIARKLGEGHRIICASKYYLRRHGTPKTPAELGRHNCIRMTAAGPLGTWNMREGVGLEPFRVKGWITVDSVDMMFDLVRTGLGIARLPSFLVRDDLRSGALVALMAKHHVAEPFPVTALMPPGRQHLPRVKALVDFLAARFD